MENLKYQIAVTLISGIGVIRAKKLIAYLGGAEAIFKEKIENLKKIPDIGPKLAYEIMKQNVLSRAEKEIEFITKNNIKALYFTDKNYPYRLKNCEDSPIVLFSKGNINFNTAKFISIVGTRKASNNGKYLCETLIQNLKQRDHQVVIVSGLAYGIDICAHKSALKNNLPTVAVFAHGLEKVYPQAHFNVAQEIVRNNGSLVSEFLSETVMDRNYFLQRNRIIAGLSDATVVVESAENGGSLFTAELANSYNREVFAFPGRVDDRYSTGCNRLIKINKACLLESVKDLEYILRWESDKNIKRQLNLSLFNDITEDHKKIINLLKIKPESMDNLIFITKWNNSKLSSLLLELEFKDLINVLPGKIFQLKS